MKNKVLSALFMVLIIGFVLGGAADPARGAAPAKGKKATKAVKEEAPSTPTAEEEFKKSFPNIKFDSMNPTAIKGVYEVVVGDKVAYFAPDPGYLIVGEIRDKNGVSITAKRREQLTAIKNEAVAARAKNLPLDKAVKIGDGKNTVIEFTDPDCPYCRKASEFLAKKADLTRYIFFMPLPMHPDAANKAKYVLCQEDRGKAYEEAMTGKLDSKKYEQCKKPEVDDLMKLYKEQAMKMEINSTPFFIVNGKVISGFDTPRIEEALKPKP